jgi:ribosomal protein S27AE
LIEAVYDASATAFRDEGVALLKTACPKCGQFSAWIEVDRVDTTLRCLCGLRKVIVTKIETVTIEHFDLDEDVKLPRKGTKLYFTLATLFALKEAATSEVTDLMNAGGRIEGVYDIPDVASQLTVLRYRRLVEVVTNRKGAPGGSTWRLTGPAHRLFDGGSVKWG